ncbi:hypothetical protein N7478_008114 [Penicillium angulare]|uniref:uncharacterized protein n=1 Tax=Penicillium angulare TaxID=116970 RepID=UPI0025407CEB|nr:uncharacterized protein N7478_008114 [Penicillium angulare]KAJ5272989.1 hypothetical protein N7478_008114 [Penicillium angulare]
MSTGHVNIIASNAADQYDFIVVGGGTAGNVIAGRLAENPKVSVLIIESGRGDPEKVPEITTPARAFESRNGPNDWKYKATLIDRPDYTRVEKPNNRGKVLGGSSCLNYYTWVRGSKGTFDEWEEFGGKGWNWQAVRDYFDKPATYPDDDDNYPHVRNIGLGGPLHIEHADLVPELRPFRDALLKAWKSKSLEINDNIYDGTMKGLTRCINTIYKGTRSSSWSFLVGKSNVHTLSSSHCKRLIVSEGHVTGVDIQGPNGEEISVKARKEVIVAAGVSASKPSPTPPHVGQNLLDHPIIPHVFRLHNGLGLDDHLLRAGPQKDGAVRVYNQDHSGPLGSGLLELVGFPRIDERLARIKEYVKAKHDNGGKDPFGPAGQPHFQIGFVPMFFDAFQWHFPVPPEGSWLTVIVDLLRPVSKPGWVKLRSSNPLDDPHINTNYFNNHLDVISLREGIRFIDDVLMTGEGFKVIIGEDYTWKCRGTQMQQWTS